MKAGKMLSPDSAFKIITLISLIFLVNSRAMSDAKVRNEKSSGYVFLPVLGYTPKTELAAGAVLNYYYRQSEGVEKSRPSNLMLSFIYTQKHQISCELPAELYWDDETYCLSGYVSYSKFPDLFFGIGNNTQKENEENYTPQTLQLRSNLQRKVSGHTYLGIVYNIKYNNLLEVDKNGLLVNGNITGHDEGRASGLGLTLFRDSRNHVFYPTQGTVFKTSLQRYNGTLGSDYTFTRFFLDLRAYFEPIQSHALAVQVFTNLMSGAPPFHMLSLLGQVGERNLMRGYYMGRFRDNNIFVLQTEYRMPVWWRFGLALFAAAGEVSHTINEFGLNKLKYTFGGGLRFQINRKERINLRMDFGFGKNSSGFYLTIGEAI
ncbi:BamA/TamA family outer membrane protein [candidate division KSB1 bacterium]|nr:BamA/TamA family outer membrane protein [candidate division KSB1 bacterium]